MRELINQNEKKKLANKIVCISADDFEIGYYREIKVVPKKITLKEIEQKLIVEYNHDFKNRQQMIENMFAKEMRKTRIERIRQNQRATRVQKQINKLFEKAYLENVKCNDCDKNPCVCLAEVTFDLKNWRMKSISSR